MPVSLVLLSKMAFLSPLGIRLLHCTGAGWPQVLLEVLFSCDVTLCTALTSTYPQAKQQAVVMVFYTMLHTIP